MIIGFTKVEILYNLQNQLFVNLCLTKLTGIMKPEGSILSSDVKGLIVKINFSLSNPFKYLLDSTIKSHTTTKYLVGECFTKIFLVASCRHLADNDDDDDALTTDRDDDYAVKSHLNA